MVTGNAWVHGKWGSGISPTSRCRYARPTRCPFRCWSPTNLPQSVAAAAMLGDLLVYLPADEERMQTALTAVVAALEGAVARTSVPPWPSAVTAVSQLAQVRVGPLVMGPCRLHTIPPRLIPGHFLHQAAQCHPSHLPLISLLSHLPLSLITGCAVPPIPPGGTPHPLPGLL